MTIFDSDRELTTTLQVTDPDFGPKYSQDHQRNVQQWIANGSIKVQQSVTQGMDNAADGFIGMFEGRNLGKTVLEVSPLSSE